METEEQQRIKELEEIVHEMYEEFFNIDVGYMPYEHIDRFNELYLKAFPELVQNIS